jgi:hypothetical protein
MTENGHPQAGGVGRAGAELHASTDRALALLAPGR